MTPREYLDIARERWRFILAGLLLGLVAGVCAGYLVPHQYSASVTVLVSAQPVDPALAAAQSGNDELSAQRINTYVELMRSKRLARDVITSLRLPDTPEQLADRVTVTTAPDSALLTAAVTAGSSDGAVSIANAVGDQFIKNVAAIEQPDDPARRPVVAAKVFESAQPPADLVAPRPVLYIVLGAALGLVLGFLSALLRHALDTRIKTRRQLEETLGVPVLGMIGRDPKIRTSPLVMYGAPHTPLAEAFRQLRTNVQFMDIDCERKVILVTSATSGEGRSTTVCNLGLALAEAGKRVLILDADLRNPSIAGCLGIDGTIGLTNVLASREWVAGALKAVGPTLDALPSGLIPPNPSELLGSKRMIDLLERMHRQYDIVLIDTAPLLPVTDAAVLAPRVDGVLVVVQHGHTSVQELQAAMAALRAVSGRVMGSVMTMVPHASTRAYARRKPWKGTRRSAFVLPVPDAQGDLTTPVPAPREDSPQVDQAAEQDQPATDDVLDRGSAAR